MSNRLYGSENEDVNLAANGIKAIAILVGFFVMFVLAYLYGAFAMGFVGMKLWAWFIVPVFGLPALTWGQAYGIALIVGLFTHQMLVPTNKDERTTPEKVGHAIAGFLLPWITLIFGYFGKIWFLQPFVQNFKIYEETYFYSFVSYSLGQWCVCSRKCHNS